MKPGAKLASGVCEVALEAEEGGKRTGQKMTHYVQPGGAFDQTANGLIADGFKINWASFNNGPAKTEKKKNKIKYTCPDCGQNAWAKPEARLVCGDCHDATGEVLFMGAEDLD